MAHKQNGAALFGHGAHFPEAFFLEGGVADGENLVHDEDFGFEVGGDGKGETHLHPRGVVFELGIEEALDFGESNDFIELAVYFGFAHTENSAAHVNIFAAGELGVKAGADFEQGSYAAEYSRAAFGRFRDARENFEKRALSRAILADNADDLSVIHIE